MPYEAARDPLAGMSASLTSPTRTLRIVTPSDSEDLSVYAKALWVSVPADIAAATVRVTPLGAADGTHVDLSHITPGLQPLPPVQVRRVWASGTTAGIAVYALAER